MTFLRMCWHCLNCLNQQNIPLIIILCICVLSYIMTSNSFVYKPKSSALPQFKVCVIGDPGVGKSMILKSLSLGGEQVPVEQFPLTTTGVDITQHVITAGEYPCCLNIWDTVGQERFSSISSGYLRNAQIVLIVYDVTDTSSFASVPKWIEKARNESDTRVLLMLVGNKVDLDDMRQVGQANANEFAKTNKMEFFECSAFKGRNILFLFNQISKDISYKFPDVLQGKAISENTLTPISINSKPPTEHTTSRKCCP